MTGRRLLALASVATLVLPVALAVGAPGGHGRPAGAKRPRIRSGLYGSGDVRLEVNVKGRKVFFRFNLYCRDPYASQYVSSGPRPVGGALKGNRRGATVYVDGEYSGVPESGVGTHQDVFWTMTGKFTGPTHFEGRVEYEAATFPESALARPQCLDAKSLHLDREAPATRAAGSRW
jgi:hypothetical protein